MLYRDIIKELTKQRGTTISELANKLGLKTQSVLSLRLKDSWNPGIKDTQELLDLLGYEIAFVPKDMIQNSKSLSQSCYIPELPEKPEK